MSNNKLIVKNCHEQERNSQRLGKCTKHMTQIVKCGVFMYAILVLSIAPPVPSSSCVCPPTISSYIKSPPLPYPIHSPSLKWAAVPTELRSCQQTWTGKKSLSDASVQKSPCPNAVPQPPRAGASSGLLADPSTPICCRNQPTTDNMPKARTVST